MKGPGAVLLLFMASMAGCVGPAPAEDSGEGAGVPENPFQTDEPAWRWVVGAPLPSARAAAACALSAGDVWSLGGIGSHGITESRVDVFDPGRGTWSADIALPTPLHHGAAVAYQGELWHLGGFRALSGNDADATASAYRLHKLGVWVQAGDLPGPLAEATAFQADGRLYLAGGTDGNDRSRAVLRLDGLLGTWMTVASLEEPRLGPAVWADEATVTVVGGAQGSGVQGEQWDLHAGTVAHVADLPEPRDHAARAVVGQLLVVAGGTHPDGTVTARVDVLDTTTGEWTMAPPLPAGLTQACAVTAAEGIHVLGGRHDAAGSPVSDHWILEWS